MAETALVTGATGFVGSHLAVRLLEEGYRLKLLVRNPEALPEPLRKQCEVIVSDLNNRRGLAFAVKDCNLVFHCVANVNTWDTLAHYQAANVYGLHNLLQAIGNNNFVVQRFVHLSSVDVYGYPDTPATEESPLVRTGFGYGDSKIDGEQILRHYAAAHNLPFTIIRPGNIFGPGSQFVRDIGRALKHSRMLTVDRGSSHAGLIYIDNLIDLLLWAAAAETALNETYNVRDACNVSWQQFVSDLKQGLAAPGAVRDLPFWLANTVARSLEGAYRLLGKTGEPPLHPLLVCMFGKTCAHSADKIRAASGITTRISYEEAMIRSIDWFIKHQGMGD